MGRRRRLAAEPLGRWMAWALRHSPVEAGVTVDAQGRCSVADLVAAARRSGHDINEADIEATVAGDEKGRFELRDGLVRAVQGHSYPVDLMAGPAVPPDVLWHGTSSRAVAAVRERGLLPMGRTHVHLSLDPDTARRVGARHGTPVVLRVDAAGMHADGHILVEAANGVWLATAVPSRYLSVP